jgi:hypothetical protein
MIADKTLGNSNLASQADVREERSISDKGDLVRTTEYRDGTCQAS